MPGDTPQVTYQFKKLTQREMAKLLLDLHAEVRTHEDFDTLREALLKIHAHFGVPATVALSEHLESVTLRTLEVYVMDADLQMGRYATGNEQDALAALEVVRKPAVADLLSCDALRDEVHAARALLGVVSGLEEHLLEVGTILGAQPGFEASVAGAVRARAERLQLLVASIHKYANISEKRHPGRNPREENGSTVPAEVRLLRLMSELGAAHGRENNLFTTERIVAVMKKGDPFTIDSIENVTLGAMLTLVKLRGSGAHINGVTTPEGWGWSICIAVGSPGNQPALELAREFGTRLTELGAPKLLELTAPKQMPTYQDLLAAIEPFRKLAGGVRPYLNAGLWVLNGTPSRWVRCGCGRCFTRPYSSPVEPA